MNKKELVRVAAKESGLTQVKVKKVVDTFIKVANEALSSGNEIKLKNFGTFRLVDLKARKGRNPQNGEPLQIDAKTVVRFRAGKEVKEGVNA